MQKQTKNDKSRQPPKDKQTNFLNQKQPESYSNRKIQIVYSSEKSPPFITDNSRSKSRYNNKFRKNNPRMNNVF